MEEQKMTTHLQEKVTLNNGEKMPWLGLESFEWKKEKS